MTRCELFRIISEPLLLRYDSREAYSAAYYLAEGLFGLERIDFLLDPDAEVDTSGVNLERIVHELSWWRPVQYVIGHVHFCDTELRVREGVLIPRPETEELVKWILEDKPGRILDVGTGSGCIAIALARHIKDSQVCAVDISDEALEIARENAQANGVTIRFGKLDALDAAADWAAATCGGELDAVVSNPPYVPMTDKEQMCFNVIRHEPVLALFAPQDDAIGFYRSIAAKSLGILRSGGSLYFEIYETMGEKIRQMLTQTGYTEIEIRKDINGKPRMMRCRKP